MDQAIPLLHYLMDDAKAFPVLSPEKEAELFTIMRRSNSRKERKEAREVLIRGSGGQVLNYHFLIIWVMLLFWKSMIILPQFYKFRASLNCWFIYFVFSVSLPPFFAYSRLSIIKSLTTTPSCKRSLAFGSFSNFSTFCIHL